MPLTALVVDDSPTSRDILGTILRHGGFDVIEAESVAEAQGAMARQTPDVVLLDIYLPGVDGFELLRRVRADPSTRGLPVIAVTAGATPEIMSKALELGCDEVIFKPEGPAEILQRVREVLARVTNRR